MFGIGKLFGGIAGGLLDKIGLGKIAPFVKMGLNALTGNWLGVAKDVFSLVSNFKGNFQNNASKFPPLGGFESPNNSNSFCGQNNPLSGNRIADLFKGLGQLFNGLKALTGGGQGSGFGKILDAFKLLGEAFQNNRMYNNRVSISQYTNIQV